MLYPRYKTIILASASSRRRKLLKEIFPRFKIIAPRIKEPQPGRSSPIRYIKRLAQLKARTVARYYQHSKALIIAADTIVYARGRIIGKPANKKDARRIMKQLSGTKHSVLTGVWLIDTATGRSVSGYEKSIIRMSKLSDAEINKIISSRRHLDKAGGYAIQESGDKYVRLIKGSMSNAVGLPLRLVRRLIRQLET